MTGIAIILAITLGVLQIPLIGLNTELRRIADALEKVSTGAERPK